MAKQNSTAHLGPPPWGFLRETQEEAVRAGVDRATGLPRTGLELYLSAIFPAVSDWIHDEMVPGAINNGKKYRGRPDYRSESLKLIVEYDGIDHYKNPDIIAADKQKNLIYMAAGYDVVRIPYFIQLTRAAVKILFGIQPNISLFPNGIASLGASGRNTPAYLCIEGIERMKKEFINFPNQRALNIAAMKKEPLNLTKWDLI